MTKIFTLSPTPMTWMPGRTDSSTRTAPLRCCKCLYENLCDNEKPTKAQMTVGGARERTSSEIEEDAQRVEEQLLALTPPPQDF